MAKKSIYPRRGVKNDIGAILPLPSNLQKLVFGARPLSKAQKRKGKTL